MSIDTLVQRHARLIEYHIQTKQQQELPGDIKHDIWCHVETPAMHYKKLYEEHKDNILVLNELVIELGKLMKFKDADNAAVYEGVLSLIHRLKRGECLR